jgi:hypothetical protein
MAFSNGQVTVGTTPTLICNVPESAPAQIANTGSVTVYLGGATVAATGASQGIPIAANASLQVPASASEDNTLYGIVASGSTTVSYLVPGSVE